MDPDMSAMLRQMAAEEDARVAADKMASEVIVNVECHGETKKIGLNSKLSVDAANQLCRSKFRFHNTEGYCLHLAFPMSVQLKPETELWKYKLKFNDDLEFKLPKGTTQTIRSAQSERRAVTTTFSTEAKPAAAATAATASAAAVASPVGAASGGSGVAAAASGAPTKSLATPTATTTAATTNNNNNNNVNNTTTTTTNTNNDGL